MSEQRPQSRMVPALVAALVGVLLGALIVLTGVLAGQRGGCCCNCYGSVCADRGLVGENASPLPTPSRPITPHGSPWIQPELQRHDVPLPGSLALMGAGLLVWRMS